MGKKKQAQRTKNNVVPASSGRSAELLQSSSTIPFAGFTTLKEGGFIPILSGIGDELDVNINEDFRLVWKKMNKKDPTTKLKALDEFKKLCQDCDVEVLKPVLPFWPRLFTTLSTDEEHRVREAAHAAHRALVTKAGRNVAPYLKQLVGPWFTGQHDTYPPAASMAEASFQDTFPPTKMTEAIIFCQHEILSYISNNLLNQTPQTLNSNPNVSQEVKDARYQRVIVSCLNGYALYLQHLPSEHLKKAQDANLELVSSSKFWKFNKDSAPIVRAAWFTAVVALCERASFLLAGESKHLCLSVFNSLDDTDSAVVHKIWQAVLLSFTVVEDVWSFVSLDKLVLAKLWKVLKDGADGNASLVYPNLLPLISKIPPTLVKDKGVFYSKFFVNLHSGLTVRSIQISGKETNAVVTAFLECMRYLIKINIDDTQLCLSLLTDQMFPLIENVIKDSKLHQARSGLFCGLAQLINSWSKPPLTPTHSDLISTFWSKLSQLCQLLIEDNVLDSAILSNNAAAIETLLSAIKNPQYQPKKHFKVKFVSPKESKQNEDNEQTVTPNEQMLEIFPSFFEERTHFINKHLNLCFNLINNCGDKTKACIIAHLAKIVTEFEALDILKNMLETRKSNWADFYRNELAGWLTDENIVVNCCLPLIFMLLKYIEKEEDAKMIHEDLSGRKWEAVLEWGLQNQTPEVKVWLGSHNGVCRLARLLTREHSSYNTLHNCLRNLRQNCWLSKTLLKDLLKTLEENLTSSSASVEVTECSADLLHSMLQNPGNHPTLALLDTDVLSTLLYQLFTASLQRLSHFPPCWQQCLTVLMLKCANTPEFSAALETCVDLILAVVATRATSLSESQQLLTVLEELITASSTSAESSAYLMSMVIGRMSDTLSKYSEAVWSLYITAETIQGSLYGEELLYRQLKSCTAKDPLASVPLEQYITGMIPFMMMIIRLQTVKNDDDEEYNNVPYAQLRPLLESEIATWTLQVLELHSLCVSFKNHFVRTKPYFLLKDKITFILEECGMLNTIKAREIVQYLKLSCVQENESALRFSSDKHSLLKCKALIGSLELIFDRNDLSKACLPYKSSLSFVSQQFFHNSTLEDVALKDTIENKDLPLINLCYCKSKTIPISILDKVFDKYVAELKENRSLLNMTGEELVHIADVADFTHYSVAYSSEHLKQSSWDACMVAAAALTLSVSTTLEEWKEKSLPDFSVETRKHSEPSQHKTWPLSLIKEIESCTDETKDSYPSLELARVICSVCRLFCTVSEYMAGVSSEQKAEVTRQAEWTEVFLPGAHKALAQAWFNLAGVECERPVSVVMLDTLSNTVAKHVQYPHFVNNDTLGCLHTCCTLLQSPETSVQLAASQQILKLIPAMIELDMKECETDNVALSCQHMDKSLLFTQSIIEVILQGLSFGDSCTVEPFTDSYFYTRSYLLLWSALLELCGNAGSQLRALYTTWLKEEYLSVFMKTVFCLMPESALHGDLPSQRISRFFNKPPQFDSGVWDSDKLAQLSCWVYARSLRRLPAAIRQWWNEAEHKVYNLVEYVTRTYVSSELCAEELGSIQTQDKLENMTVHVLPSAKEVYAVYTLEESRMELVIELAPNHPLGLVKVKSGQSMVSTAQTRQWLLQITIFLTHQNGSIRDALELWKTSLDKRFDGVEECYICFAVLHCVSHQLPKLSCQTCRKKFHTHCLYKWFTTSNKSTCPICRNLF